MDKLKIILGSVIVGIGVGLIYFFFEAAVSGAIDFIWNETFNIDDHRLLIIPLTFIGTFLFFGSQHLLDSSAENKESEGLGEIPKASAANIVKVLLIGFLSLVAGASLGPEAILVPASVLFGIMLAPRVSSSKQISKLFTLLAFVALFTAFFDSLIAGFAGLWLALDRSKAKADTSIILLSFISAGSTLWILNILESDAYLTLPDQEFSFSITSVLLLIAAVLAGYLLLHLLEKIMNFTKDKLNPNTIKPWYIKATIIACGMSLIYTIGGPLIMFTGNEAVKPMLNEADSLGIAGLIFLAVVKMIAISWSKVGGFRGGLVFPNIFVAATLSAAASMYFADHHIGLGALMIILGMLIANSKKHVLF